jgi:3-oxoacyl-[acyl-carrier protein] reductase
MKNNEKPLAGKVAVVTGSSQGVGKGIAVYFARMGAKVVVNNRKPPLAEDTAREINAEGGEATACYADVADYAEAGKLVSFALDKWGRLDILVNNAAGLGTGTILTTEEAEWDKLYGAKLKGAYNCMHQAVPAMLAQGFGRVINCASDAWVGQPNLCGYSAANAGVVGLTWASSMELADKGVTVNAYCPQAASPGHDAEFGPIAAQLPPEIVAKVQADHGPAENLAPFLAWLCTPDAGKVTGQVFSLTASGRVGVYSRPEIRASIHKDGEPWTVEEVGLAAGELGLVKI